jgi:FixJ family two-component response regulator
VNFQHHSGGQASQTPPTVHIVDDDLSMRGAIGSLLRSAGIAVQTYASAEEFLQRRPERGLGCLVLDVQLPGTSGFELQETLNTIGEDIPVIFLTGHGTIPLTVKAMRAGAVEFLTKPFTEIQLLGAIDTALARDRACLAERAMREALLDRYALLTPREREVFALVAQGRLNKVVAAELGISEITAKVHRRHVMEKLKLRTVADLVRTAEHLERIRPAGGTYTKV